MTAAARPPLAVKVLLTLTSFEFFGPLVRDFSPSHAFNPTWVGHARVHLIWLRRPVDTRDLWLSALWQSCNLGGFWVAYLLGPIYGGLITVPGIHVHIFGFDENVLVFAVLSIVLGL